MSSKKHGGYPQQAKPAYPVQGGSYPVQTGPYPMQANYSQPSYPGQAVPPQHGYAAQPAPSAYAGAPGPYPYAGQYGPPPPYAPPGHQPVPQPQYVGIGQYDPGARFDTAQAHVPPPPPGCAPNAAQFAMMQGGKAMVNNSRPTNFFWGGDGGVSWDF